MSDDRASANRQADAGIVAGHGFGDPQRDLDRTERDELDTLEAWLAEAEEADRPAIEAKIVEVRERYQKERATMPHWLT